MSKLRKILAPTDYSDLSCIGLGRAFEIAHESGAELIVLHVIDMGNDWFGKSKKSRAVAHLDGRTDGVPG